MDSAEIIAGERLDQYVVRQLPALSRSAAVHIIEDGAVAVNGKGVTKAGHKLREADSVKINYDQKAADKQPKLVLPIIYEDKSCVVINKPAGVLSHSKGAFNPEETVATWLTDKVEGLSGERAGIVHRLDRATSGVMIGGKTAEAVAWLQKQFSQRKVKKTYQAVVSGRLGQEHAIIDMPIERHPKKPQTFRVGQRGKAATTEYQVLANNGRFSLLELRPTTGRTHQLRVHLKQLGHPIVGDTLYGGQPAKRLYLHAESLELTLPNKQRRTFTVPTPADFRELVS